MLRPLPAIPSYKRYLERRKFYWQARRRTRGAALQFEMQTLGRINKKVKGTNWVRELGLPTVRDRIYPSVAAGLRATMREKFVLKPEGGHSSAGVYLLTRDGKGGYDCAMTGRHYTSDDALESHFHQLRSVQGKGDRVSESVIIEDLVEDSFGFDVPLDYKVYAFSTGSPVVMQRYAPLHKPREKWAFAFYDSDGTDLGAIRLRTAGNPDGMLKPPACLDAIFDQARQMIDVSGVSFMRIDMYATPTGPVFGEFTPVPNNALEEFIPEYDALLGQAWADSLEERAINYTRMLLPKRKMQQG